MVLNIYNRQRKNVLDDITKIFSDIHLAADDNDGIDRATALMN
jgi:hypothetical protein